jgi:glycosyltransferase involved in cell wall biosynthesis
MIRIDEKMVLWIAPELNHYKINQLNKLSLQINGLKVVHGLSGEQEGHKLSKKQQIYFDHILVKSTYRRFNWDFAVYQRIYQELKHNNFRTVLMPMEKKHIFLILFLYALKFIFNFRLASYNHHYKNKGPKANRVRSFVDKKICCLMTKLYDVVVYYTEKGMRRSIEKKIVDKRKAFFASNTIDVESIFSITDENDIKPEDNILFIGRIVPSKRIDILIEYFQEIKKSLKGCKLFIIGDGPELEKYNKLSKRIKDVYWLGGIVGEEVISRYAQISKIAFVPGHSGLSINHSFAYGKPYVTLERETHPPEIDYLVNGKNGLILSLDDKENNIKKILRLLTDDTYYSEMSAAALETAKQLTLENWVISIRKAIRM